ncbi:MAG: hypothetical protein E6R03_10355 [Hyphomicrobiaceae bacterium]|nr:MAG: hypothetical protein E6R03_10355 [Hyphomicrobiaceae bacterium]
MSNAPDEPTEAERTIFNAFYAPNHQRVRLSAIRAHVAAEVAKATAERDASTAKVLEVLRLIADTCDHPASADLADHAIAIIRAALRSIGVPLKKAK